MGTGNSASRAATAANAQQQAQINATIQQINSAYGSPQRTQQYSDFGRSLLDYYTGQVNTQEATNARNLKFAEARSGLSGGSASVDANTQLAKDYTQGLLQASKAAQTGQASLEQSDIASKNQLIAEAEQGAYLGSIPQAVASATSANLGAAQNYGNTNALANLFSGTANIYQNEQVAAANRKAQQSPIGSVYGGNSQTSVWG